MLFLIQGDKPHLMNWERYGLRIGVQEASLSSTDTVEAAVVTLVGGQFQFPPNTVLVSAVYAVSLSKPLLKQLILEIQHCVDLTGRPALSRHLKFAIAPMSTPSLPYRFSIVEGVEFSSNSWYGSIEGKEFCLVCILGLLFFAMTGILGGGGGGGGQLQQGGGVVPAQQQQGGDALTAVLAQQQQPGVNQQIQGQQGEETQEGQVTQVEHEEGQGEQVEGEVQGEGDQSQEEEKEQQEEGQEQSGHSGELQGEGGDQQGGQEQREPQEQGLEQQQEEGGIQEEGVHQEGEKDPVYHEETTPAVSFAESSSNSKHQSIHCS